MAYRRIVGHRSPHKGPSGERLLGVGAYKKRKGWFAGLGNRTGGGGCGGGGGAAAAATLLFNLKKFVSRPESHSV